MLRDFEIQSDVPSLDDQHGDANVRLPALGDEIPGMNDWIDSRNGIDQVDIDWADMMERRGLIRTTPFLEQPARQATD